MRFEDFRLNHLLITILLVIFVLLGVFEAFSAWNMSKPSQVALVILLIAATLWISELIPLYVTSFVILIMSATWLYSVMRESGVTVSRSAFTSPFFSNIILLFMGGFVLSSAFQKFRIDEKLAKAVIARTGSSVPRVLVGIMAITAFLSMWLSNTATTAMMLALCLPIMESLPKGDRYRKAILLAIPFSANIGGLGTPIGTPPNAIAIQYLRQLGMAATFGLWMVLAVPMVIVLLGAIWVMLMVFFKGSAQTISLNSTLVERKRTFEEILVLCISGVTVVGWLTGKFHGLPSGIVALLPVVVFFGLRMLNVQDLRSLPWDVLILMGGGLCLGTGISRSGLAQWPVSRLPTQGSSLVLLILVFALIACLMSSLMSNTATANLVMPIVAGLGVGAISPLMVAVAFACSVAMPLPISTPPNAIAFSTGQITVKDMIKPGLLVTIFGIILVLTLGLYWWQSIGLF